jgi:hypothetical protein
MAKGGSRKVGGGGAAEFGVAAYGAAGSQMARGDGTNMIAINANACTKGGARGGARGGKRVVENRGGAFLDTIAVPAAFIAANTMYKGRKVYNRSHKFGKRMKKMTRRQRRR